MAHWYLDNRGSPELFGKDHRKWGRLQGGPLNKDGSRSQVRRDLANHEKAVTDFLVARGVIEDDYLAQELHMAWAPITGCQVTIEEVAE